MALTQGIWSDGLVSQPTPDRFLSRQHSHECHAWLTYNWGFRNETPLFHVSNLPGWSQKQFESFLHGYGSLCLNQATQRSCCLMYLSFSLPCCCAALLQQQLRVAVLPCDLHSSLGSFHFLADTPELYLQRERRGFHTKLSTDAKCRKLCPAMLGLIKGTLEKSLFGNISLSPVILCWNSSGLTVRLSLGSHLAILNHCRVRREGYFYFL